MTEEQKNLLRWPYLSLKAEDYYLLPEIAEKQDIDMTGIAMELISSVLTS